MLPRSAPEVYRTEWLPWEPLSERYYRILDYGNHYRVVTVTRASGPVSDFATGSLTEARAWVDGMAGEHARRAGR